MVRRKVNNKVSYWIKYIWTYRSFAIRVSQLKIWHFWVTGIERNAWRCTFNRYSVITRFAKLAAGEWLCHRCTCNTQQHFKTLKTFLLKNHRFWVVTLLSQLWHCCHSCDTVVTNQRYILHSAIPMSRIILFFFLYVLKTVFNIIIIYCCRM